MLKREAPFVKFAQAALLLRIVNDREGIQHSLIFFVGEAVEMSDAGIELGDELVAGGEITGERREKCIQSG